MRWLREARSRWLSAHTARHRVQPEAFVAKTASWQLNFMIEVCLSLLSRTRCFS